MAKPQVISDRQFEHMLKATAAYSRVPERDKALLLTLYGTALAVTELACLTVADYLMPTGEIHEKSRVRAEIAHNGVPRPLYWTNKRVSTALDEYLAWRVKHKHGVTVKHGAYRGLDPSSAVFLTEAGAAYGLTEKVLVSGALSYSCNALTAYISRLHANAGIEGGSAQSARRTFATKLRRLGYDYRHLAEILGVKSVTTVKRLVEADPVDLGEIVAGAV
ncbi:site-specific integrase [Comamonas sp. Z1]|uniref:tyrosine-type recombinase/integrase n=1 Tax=Comamonas TaxID=283 RepID=UPI0011E76354|nr:MULTISPECIES: site-specific integrase [Comamonas]TYK74143.1 site-specific integrase [Comamonas sp. Z1]UUC96572.1 site-specific integrase [Comamonas sp. C11]